MTLYRQLIIAVLAALMVLYLGNLVVSFNSTKALVARQMETHAQDAATSLAFSMTQATEGDDIATLDTMLNAVSDSGYYQRIYFVDMEGEVALERIFPVSIAGVPQWFIGLMELPNYEGHAEVSAGWVRLGELVVISHPGQAYQNLWDVLVRQLIWFTVMGGGVCFGAFFAVRLLLSPLGDVEEQANAICEQRFIQQEKIPRTRELKAVVEAMNRLSARLEGLFNTQSELIRDLRHESHTDAVTGLSNRTDFDARLRTIVDDEKGTHCGTLMIFALHDIDRINDLAGRAEGNEVLKSLGQNLKSGIEGHPLALVARRQGLEFTVFVPDVDQDEADALAESLIAEAYRISWEHHERLPLTITMGYTYSEEVKEVPQLLSEADMALQGIDTESAQTYGKYSSLDVANAPVVSRSVFDWKQFIEKAIDDKALELHAQETFSVPGRERIAHEVYARFQSPDDSQLTAGSVMPMVQRYGYSVDLDKLVLQLLAETAPPGDGTIAVNICHDSIGNEEFCSWLGDFLNANEVLASRLVMEISEHALKMAEDSIGPFEQILSRYRSGLGVDHFGLESSAFGYLASLPLRHLKVHSSFVKDIHLSRDNQFYVKALAQLAQTREIKVIVEGVETEAEWQVLADMNIDGAQGYFLGRPQPIQDS